MYEPDPFIKIYEHIGISTFFNIAVLALSFSVLHHKNVKKNGQHTLVGHQKNVPRFG